MTDNIKNQNTSQSRQETLPNLEELILEANKAAMDYLRNEDYASALSLLRQSEKILLKEYQEDPNENLYRLIGITLNNLGCYYKRTNKLNVALKYLKKALQIEIFTLNDKTNIAGTHLNICAILSAMNSHHEAIRHVKLALELLEMAKSQMEENGIDDKQRYGTIITTIIIAHYNYGTELEYIKEYHSSFEIFSQGYQLALKELGSEHPLTITLEQNTLNVSVKKKEYEEKLNIKNLALLRTFEANRNIRQTTRVNQSFSIEDTKRKKTIEYGYDGHIKYVPYKPRGVFTRSIEARRDNSPKTKRLPPLMKGADRSPSPRIAEIVRSSLPEKIFLKKRLNEIKNQNEIKNKVMESYDFSSKLARKPKQHEKLNQSFDATTIKSNPHRKFLFDNKTDRLSEEKYEAETIKIDRYPSSIKEEKETSSGNYYEDDFEKETEEISKKSYIDKTKRSSKESYKQSSTTNKGESSIPSLIEKNSSSLPKMSSISGKRSQKSNFLSKVAEDVISNPTEYERRTNFGREKTYSKEINQLIKDIEKYRSQKDLSNSNKSEQY